MTYNSVIRRIQQIVLAHKQVRTFAKAGSVTDFLTDKTTKYPAVFLQSTGGSISTTGAGTTINFRMFFLDLVNVSEDAKTNETDVESDMIAIAMDVVAQINQGDFNDWIISTDNSLQIIFENDNDLLGGCSLDFSLRIQFSQNVCAIPSDLFLVPDSGGGAVVGGIDQRVYDETYVATGNEGATFSVFAVMGKKILFVTRSSNPLYRVSLNPNTTEYIWDNTQFVFGIAPEAGEKFLILYRNY